MKILIRILAFFLVCYLSYSMLAQNKPPLPDKEKKETGDKIQEPNIDLPDDDAQEIDDDEYSIDQDIISSRVMQKEMEPISNKEKIKWSFRLADTNAFL